MSTKKVMYGFKAHATNEVPSIPYDMAVVQDMQSLPPEFVDTLPAQYFVICQHPIDALEFLEESYHLGITQAMIEEQVPKNPDGTPNWHLMEDEGMNLNGNTVIFIWHGHGGLSAIAWYTYICDNLTKQQSAILRDICVNAFI